MVSMHKPFDIQAFNRGDEKSFKIIFDKYYRILTYYAMKRIDDDSSKEAVSLAFIRLFSVIRKGAIFNSEDHVRITMWKYLKQAIVSKLKPKGGFTKHITCTENIGEYGYEEMETDNLRIEATLLHAIYTRSSILPKTCQKIFKAYMHGQTFEEIATEMGLSPQTVRNQKTRAISLLRADFKAHPLAQ